MYTTKELDYAKYLAYAGLKIDKQIVELKDKPAMQKFIITRDGCSYPFAGADFTIVVGRIDKRLLLKLNNEYFYG